MKPSELLKDLKYNGITQDIITLLRYNYQDVITSYIKNSFGIIFLIKGKIKPFAFVVIDKKLSYGYYNIKQIPIKEFFNLREQIELKKNEEVVFIDKEKEKQIKALCLLEELKDK